MIVIELEEKKYGKIMEAVSKVKEYAECLEDIISEHSMGARGGMSHRGGSRMGMKEYPDEEYYGSRMGRRPYPKEEDEYSRFM